MKNRKEASEQLDILIGLSNAMPLDGEDTLQAAIVVIGGLELSIFMFNQETEDVEFAYSLKVKAEKAKKVMLERVKSYLEPRR